MKTTLRHDTRLVCCPVALRYDFRTRQGALVLDDGDCCDMAGCIAMFVAIDPEVLHIQTWSGTVPDTAYCRDSLRADWCAFFRGQQMSGPQPTGARA